jgi:hypothetical protein
MPTLVMPQTAFCRRLPRRAGPEVTDFTLFTDSVDNDVDNGLIPSARQARRWTFCVLVKKASKNACIKRDQPVTEFSPITREDRSTTRGAAEALVDSHWHRCE